MVFLSAMDHPETWRKAEVLFKKHGGMLRTSRAIALGVHPRVLYGLRDAGRLQQVTRGLYRLSDLPELGSPDLAAVAARIPQGVICLISALAFHGITTQIPHQVDVAVPRGTKQPRLQFPPIRLFRFSAPMQRAGIERHRVDNIEVRVYSAAKTVADCFRFRSRIGIDVAVEALKLFHGKKKAPTRELLQYARLCRVERVMMPYLEALQ
jgi:predicted transcriptional regulator of viral defense system